MLLFFLMKFEKSIYVKLILTQSRLVTSCTHAGGLGVNLYDDPDLKLFIIVCWVRDFLSVAWLTWVFFLSRCSVMLFDFTPCLSVMFQ